MNDDASNTFWIGTAFGVLIGVMPLMIVGSWIGKWEMRNSAIKANVGYYDAKTGDFKYKIMDEDSSM